MNSECASQASARRYQPTNNGGLFAGAPETETDHSLRMTDTSAKLSSRQGTLVTSQRKCHYTWHMPRATSSRESKAGNYPYNSAKTTSTPTRIISSPRRTFNHLTTSSTSSSTQSSQQTHTMTKLLRSPHKAAYTSLNSARLSRFKPLCIYRMAKGANPSGPHNNTTT